MECPHLSSITRIKNPFIKEGLVPVTLECSVCRSKRNPWMCIYCGVLNCGRYAKGHAVEHFEHMKHHIISIDCHELAIYCHICDDFVNNQKCYKYFHKLRLILQGNQTILGKLLATKRSSTITAVDDVKVTKIDVSEKKTNKKEQKTAICRSKTSGLRNLGNTCFMNAVLQSLCNIQLFSYYFLRLPSADNPLRSPYLKPMLKGENLLVTAELRKTIVSLWDGNKSVISPQSLFAVIWKIVPRFRGYQQQDAHEFLRYMLDRLHTELSTVRPSLAVGITSGVGPGSCGSSVNGVISTIPLLMQLKSTIVTTIFGGILQNEVHCLICGNESRKQDPFFDISLDIPQKYTQVVSTDCTSSTDGSSCTLTECLAKFIELEQLADTELYSCPNCKKKQKSTKRFWIRRLPNVLCLHLKRFKWNDQNRSKLDMHIEFPTKDLDMSDYLLSNMHETRNSCRTSPIYDLAAVIVHHGNGIRSGHYTSYATHEGCWHHFNDSSVTICNEETVLKSNAYILFYVRREINLKSFFYENEPSI